MDLSEPVHGEMEQLERSEFPVDVSLPVSHLFKLTISTASHENVRMGDIPSGDLYVVTLMEGDFVGDALSGRVVSTAGGDWVRVRGDGIIHLDMRVVLRTESGDDLYFRHRGVGFEWGDSLRRIRGSATIETVSERYAYLNRYLYTTRVISGDGRTELDVYALL